MFWLIVVFVVAIMIYWGVDRIEKSEKRKQNTQSSLEHELRQQLIDADIEYTEESLQALTQNYQIYHSAFAYFDGDGVPQDYKKAYELWSEVAEIFPLSNVLMGTMSLDGLVAERNPKLALEYFHKALELNEECHEAMFQIARLYELGEDVVQDNQYAFQLYQKAADLGNVDAENQLAWAFYVGLGVTKNQVRAFIKWLALAENGHVDAQRLVGICCYFTGHGTNQNFEQAFYWIKRAAESNNLEAIANLGMLYMYGLGTSVDFSQAQHWLQKAVDQGHIQATIDLGSALLMENDLDRENVQRAIVLWESMLDTEGHQQVIDNLGLLYLYGCQSIQPNAHKAFPYLQQSAELGSLAGSVGYAVCLVELEPSPENIQKAQGYIQKTLLDLEQFQSSDISQQSILNLLGLVYIEGKVFDKDIHKALDYFERAAQFNHPSSQYRLATLYAEGVDVHQNDDKAFFWYQKAAHAGVIEAQNNLGAFYALGRGVTQDYEQACYWFIQAMQKGDASAINNMGEMYENGYGVEQNYSEAFTLFEQANKKGNIDSSFNLGNLYYYGRGVLADQEKAKSYYQQAASQGFEKAIQQLERL
ncbi:tetratricopeptide repeat protein [Acinetobacter higginsii]|uniref:tetratricopeptide repeat protein n=1 Tax=Acinetobacter higginsii TaxID=70347 RepID=UPI001F4ABF5C|nr:sel1 repeat family protein [Acinetobacter higginsii]MCH7296809.1 sel1 repeat family protein [Acinetobacter higginsii]